MSVEERTLDGSAAISNVWKGFVANADSPGFSLRTTFPSNPDGVEVMLERWSAGTNEPPHFHPGDDMTIVIEGRMSVQFYRLEDGTLIVDGDSVILNKGDVGYVRANRVHDAKYLEDCELVYVHDGAFAFNPVEAELG